MLYALVVLNYILVGCPCHNNYLPAQLVALTVENDFNSESGKSTFMGACEEFFH